MPMNLRSHIARMAVMALILLAATVPARAFTIQEVTSPGGIKAWLVEDHAVPLIAMNFSFRVGSSSDPVDKPGVANFLTGMMDEGADDLDSAAFQKQRDELAFRMSYDAGRDFFEGSFQTLSRNRDAAVELLRKAVTAPRFEPEPMERVRQQLLLGIRNDSDDPQTVASRAWLSLALPGDPYARDKSGTEQSVMAIGPDDLSAAHRRIFGRKTLQVSVVGDITAAELGVLLDRVFLALPEGEGAPPLPPVAVATAAQTKVIARDIPQSIIIFGHGGILRRDPDFIPAYIMSEILGGGGFGSRLTTEVREKRGLTYGIVAGFMPLERVGLFIGSLSTRNDKAGEAMELVKAEFRRMAEEGPTQEELDEAKTYLTGSYALRFTSGNAIAGQLLGLQQQGFGPDYVARRNGMIEAVTLDQVKTQAKRLLHPEQMIVTVVGKPEGLN